MAPRLRAAVLGSPIHHSLSPVLHRAAYVELGLIGRRYDAVEVDEAALADFVRRCGSEWSGLSLTMPLKRAVLPLLDTRSATVELTTTANTVVFDDNGRHGYNTDVGGLVGALAEAGIETATTALVLGGGATAASAMAAIARLGAREVTLALRRPSAAGPLLDLAERVGLRLAVVGWNRTEIRRVLPGAHLVVATSPAGSTDDIAAALVAGDLAPGATLFDVLYAPWPTLLAARWALAGGGVLGGLDLLVHQAVRQVELMTGCGEGHRAHLVQAMRAAGLLGLKT